MVDDDDIVTVIAVGLRETGHVSAGIIFMPGERSREPTCLAFERARKGWKDEGEDDGFWRASYLAPRLNMS